MDLEERDYEEYARRIKQIDQILQEPVHSVINLVIAGIRPRQQPPSGFYKRSIEIPAGVLEDQEGISTTQINTALCCSTLQRIWIHRRRFPHLASKLAELEKELIKGHGSNAGNVPDLLAEPFLPIKPDAADFKDYVRIVANPDGGPCDPYTASQVFWVLLNAGERNAHTATGFFAVFSMLWALRRRFPQPGGVSVGNSPPSAYVTAKCLAPLFTLVQICGRRASLFDTIAQLIGEIRELMEHPNKPRRAQWLPLRLDELSGKLYELSSIAISREGFRSCAQEIGEIADRLHTRSGTDEPWAQVIASLVRALRSLGTVGNQGLSEARRVVVHLLPSLVRALREPNPLRRSQKLAKLGLPLKLPPFHAHTGKVDLYWEDYATSAELALAVCTSAFNALARVSRQCSKLPAVSAVDLLAKPKRQTRILDLLLEGTGLFRDLSESSREVASQIESGMSEAMHWCDVTLVREIAHASANHLTEFDPAELVSALFVTVSGQRLDSSLRVGDAVGKALVGVRGDGSWVPGQPFFLEGDLGIWAPTSDIVWMLSSTILRYPEVRAADLALGQYIDWLERTRKRVMHENHKSSQHTRMPVYGWISERNLREKRIDIWATVFAINALLGIRELMEYRLWELCEKRFTVLSPTLKLSDIDAVDLGASHAHRLHRRLAWMARQAVGDEYKDAEYSLVLHGPPGSSKTAIAQALAATWRSSLFTERRNARLIRITPADFTRKGEDRLDAEARLIFELLGQVRGITVLFDEIDDLLRMRDGRGEASFFKLVVPGMLNRLQDLRDACPKQEICFVLATNYVDRIEPALLRRGRIDRAMPLVYPDRESRRCTLGKHVKKLQDQASQEPWRGWAAEVLDEEIGQRRIHETDYWPWKTFDTLCKEVIGEFEAHGRAAHSELDLRQLARQAVDRAIHRGNAMVSPTIYDSQRRKRLGLSAELKEEILQYSLAGAEDIAELLDVLATNGSWRAEESLNGNLRIQSAAASALKTVLGQDLLGKLQEIATTRGWSQKNVSIADATP